MELVCFQFHIAHHIVRSRHKTPIKIKPGMHAFLETHKAISYNKHQNWFVEMKAIFLCFQTIIEYIFTGGSLFSLI